MPALTLQTLLRLGQTPTAFVFSGKRRRTTVSKVETRPRPPRMRSTVSSTDEAAESTAELPIITMTPTIGSDPAVLTAADNSEVGTGLTIAVAAAIRVRYRVPCSGIIGKVIYHPTRTSSSRMSSHLRFVIVAAANPNILLIDEALSTGDKNYLWN